MSMQQAGFYWSSNYREGRYHPDLLYICHHPGTLIWLFFVHLGSSYFACPFHPFPSVLNHSNDTCRPPCPRDASSVGTPCCTVHSFPLSLCLSRVRKQCLQACMDGPYFHKYYLKFVWLAISFCRLRQGTLSVIWHQNKHLGTTLTSLRIGFWSVSVISFLKWWFVIRHSPAFVKWFVFHNSTEPISFPSFLSHTIPKSGLQGKVIYLGIAWLVCVIWF